MKKTITFLKTLLLAVILLVGSGNVWGQKITDVANIVSGQSYYIGATTGGTDYYLSVSGDGSTIGESLAGTAVTKASANVFTFVGSGSTWTIQFDLGNYLSLKTVKDNGKVSVQTTAANFIISNQNSLLKMGISTSFSIQKNNSTTNFGNYGNTQTYVWLEPAVASCTTPTTSFSTTSVSKLMTDGTFTNTFTSDNTSTKVWTSSNEAVATVDIVSGLVTIVGAGSANIRVNQAADDTYCAVLDASYTLTVTAPPAPDAPTATAATSVTSGGFTANWGAVSGATGYKLDVYEKVSGGNATDLFISEYIEGTSNNKYIEIFNGTGSAVDLSNYKLQLYANGATSTTNDVTLSGTLANGATIVYKNSAAVLTLPDGVTATNNTAVGYNGDDAVALYKISTSSFVDIFGRIGNDPGTEWTGDGGYTTVDKTLVRKASVTSGITTSPTGTGSTAFTTLTTEWDLYNTDVVANLGSHTFSGGSSQTYVSGFENYDAGNVITKAVIGLNASTDYYYVVRAYNANGTSENSNEIAVSTLGGAATPEPSAHATGFTATANTSSQITVTWTDATGGQVPDGYLVKAAIGTPAEPADGAAEADVALVQNIAYGVGTAVFTGLDASTTYNFSIWPYTNSGAAIDYKIGSEPTTSAMTNDAPAVAKIFISEYIEGSSNNKAIEIYNGESTAIDLTKLVVNLFSNGNIVANTSYTGSGSLAPGASVVIYDSGSATGISSVGTVSAGVAGFNGNDAINVVYDGQVTDVFGEIGANPSTGWSVAGVSNATADQTLLRKLTVIQGNTTSLGSFGTTTENSEWVIKDQDYFDNLGEFGSAFLGTTDSDWATATNWDMGIPASSRAAIIPSTTNKPVVNENIEVAGLLIKSGGELTISAAKQLTVSGAITNAGTLNLLSTTGGAAATLTAATASGTGTTNVSQYLKDARNWYVASPVADAALPATGYSLFERNETNNSWPTPTSFTQGKGYIALPTTAPSTLTFSGTLNLDDVDVALTYSSAVSSKGFNLIGNPYPSHLTWTKAFVEDATNAALIEPTIWIRTNAGSVNKDGDADWSFLTYNATAAEAVPSTANGGIIPTMQSFWVRAKKAGNLSLDSKLTRSHQSSNPLKAPAINNTERQRLRLVASNGISTDETLIYFDASANNGFDVYDSPKFEDANAAVQLYTKVGTEQLVINGMNTIPTEIPLYFKANASTASQFSISATEFSNFENGTKVYIKDNNTGFEQLISESATYNFDATATPNFSVVFKAPGVISGFENNNTVNFNVYANAKGQLTVSLPLLTGNDIVAVYNSTGQRVMSQTLTNTQTLLNNTFATGVYVVRVNEVSHKVIVK